IYFGTRTGQLFGSRDDGDTWTVIADYLPQILCVRAVEV
ncbi:MAG: exo-alpha-sialidase, partial [Deltaproteobacteria bacterium]|nr:exo-alpha-sialidase [Deltaproteobacteria bacterium]